LLKLSPKPFQKRNQEEDMKTYLNDLKPERKFEIADLADFIAEEYGADGRIDPQTIARKKDITFSYGYYKDAFDGMLEYQNKRFHIYSNLSRSERFDSPRARFTFAHELGHYFIDEHRNALASGFAPAHASVCEYESESLIEREADCFASNLLMPPSFFQHKAKASRIGLESIMKLREYFNTSMTSTAVRYVQLGLAPCIMIMWSGETINWTMYSDHVSIKQFQGLIHRSSSLDQNSPTLWALRGARTPYCGFFAMLVKAKAWFPNLRDPELREQDFIEQSVRLGQYGVITLLFPT
jgi:Zn-dependent peptidase ImmA (M78 family)